MFKRFCMKILNLILYIRYNLFNTLEKLYDGYLSQKHISIGFIEIKLRFKITYTVFS
jgi:hypothetical protein